MAGDEGSRRRLPSWSCMKKPDDGDKSNNSVQENKISCETKRQRKKISTQPLTTNIKKRKVGKSKKPTPRDDGEGEFSVEDLLSIAKEFVQIDLDTAELQSVDRDFESQDQRLKTTFCEDGISNCNLTSVQSRTGDPAQDMLDLFLGPLLKKPRGDKEKKTEFTTNDEGFRQLSQNDVGEEMVSHIKSKSSLKDKVAMFLD
ncbi:hypothetical protein Patl1_15765 [Pistacia atlantica]|uniref:Uncharacterized protein n=1 Tax=Pistacia atlantica TaxID=434234 RepID=A0ACC1B8V9_9ROSI|nr:hypothetical protein Patl1_15765 [Pistacia atlantica]